MPVQVEPREETVAVGGFASLASQVSPSILEGFRALHPGIEVSVHVGTHDDLLTALENGALDMALAYDFFLPTGFFKRTIYRTQLEVDLLPDHPPATGSRPTCRIRKPSRW